MTILEVFLWDNYGNAIFLSRSKLEMKKNMYFNITLATVNRRGLRTKRFQNFGSLGKCIIS